MGSHDFTKVVMSSGCVQDAYRSACHDATFEYGHDAYNGSISTTSGVHEVRGVKPMTQAEAETLAYKRIDMLQKWGYCEALPLVAESPAVYERTGSTTVTVTVTGAVFADTAKFRRVLAKAAEVKERDIDQYSVVHENALRGGRRLLSAVPLVKAATPAGKPVKRYFIVPSTARALPRFEDGYATQAEARAALASKFSTTYGARVNEDLEIIAVTRREGGEPLVRASVSTKSVTGTFEVRTRKLVTPAKRGTTRAGWYFYGWAAC